MAKSDATSQRRARQHGEIRRIVGEQLEPKLQAAREAQAETDLLNNVASGLYSELDKLCKKSPTESVTDLMLEQVNDLIQAVKALVAEDSYVQKLKVFVPAGDNPEQRDVLMVLRMLIEGLKRFGPVLKKRRERGDGALHEAEIVAWALESYIENGRTVEVSEIERVGTARAWFAESGRFNFKMLDETDLADYFER
jgi:hypothetical protein